MNKKMTAQEIISYLKENEYLGSYFAYELEGTTHDLLGKIEEVDSEGDYEGGGEYAMKVLHFVDHDVYLKLEGAYYSYNSTEWDDELKEVRPQEKTITVYE